MSALDLRTQEGRYDLAVDIKAQISGKVKSYGMISYDQSTKVLTMKITEVKFGFFNLTDKVFQELKKNESPKMVVKKPFVYLDLK